MRVGLLYWMLRFGYNGGAHLLPLLLLHHVSFDARSSFHTAQPHILGTTHPVHWFLLLLMMGMEGNQIHCNTHCLTCYESIDGVWYIEFVYLCETKTEAN